MAAGLHQRIKRGDRIAITGGSRSMGSFAELLAGIGDAVQAAKGQPLLIPAMGSHGGATEKGQMEILRCLGVTAETVGAPICATMETVELGTSSTGAVVHLDCYAATADGIIVLGRTQTYPESAAGLASGLLKMTTVGLSKQIRGTGSAQSWPGESVAAVPRVTLAKTPILCGVAVGENAYRQPVVIEVVPPTYDAFTGGR